MALPAAAYATIFNAIGASKTTVITDNKLLAGFPDRASAIILEVIGASTPNFTLDIQGKVHQDGTYVNWDYVEIGQAGAAALANAQLTVNDTTRRFYLIPYPPPFVQLVATFTGGTLTIHAAYTTEPLTQFLLTTARGSLYVEGPAASDAAEAGNPVQIGISVDETSPTAAAEGDVRRAIGSQEGVPYVAIVKPGQPGNIASVENVNADSITAGTETLAVLSFLHAFAPDGAFDRVRGLGNTALLGLGQLAAAPWVPGASTVTTARSSATASTTVATLATPASGKKLRLVFIAVTFDNATAARFEVYFATGANIGSTAGKEAWETFLDVTDKPADGIVFPDGGGPVGAADDVLSIRSSGTAGTFTIIAGYRDE